MQRAAKLLDFIEVSSYNNKINVTKILHHSMESSTAHLK